MDIRNRRYVRLNTDIPAEISRGENPAMPVRVVDLSQGGVKIATNSEVAFQLLQHDQPALGQIQDLEINIHFELANTPAPLVVEARCRALFLARQSQDRFTFGCQFLTIDADLREQLEEFIQQNIGKKNYLLSGE